jgi:hypothetical protein
MWPATQPYLFVPLLIVLWYVPIGAILGLGNLRFATWLGWLGTATVVLAGLAIHDVARGVEGGLEALWLNGGPPGAPAAGASFVLTGSLFFLLFIAHSLVSAADAERRVIAGYHTYFDVAWKLEVQIALAAFFTGLFWLVLWLGAELFELIHIRAIRTLIEHRWFATPATTLAFAYALHVTDARIGLVVGMRNLLHVLMSWLLPLATLLVAGFLLTLPFTGLTVLWNTRFSAQLLFWAAAILVVLVNTAYRDGERAPAVILRIAGTVACVCLVPLIVLSAYSVMLRVRQYGWTVERISGTAVLIVAAVYAVGYLWAAVPGGAWLRRIERCNVAAAYIIIAVMLALLTPLADPARLAVADQVARLQQGRIAADKFDYAFLRFRSGRYGRDALDALRKTETGAEAEEIRRRATQAAAQTNEYNFAAPTTPELAAHITVYPRGRTLPPSFVQQNWAASLQRYMFPTCLTNAAQNCEAFLVDLDGSGVDQIVLAEGAGQRRAMLFKVQGDGKWQLAGTFPWQMSCDSVREKLRTGQFTVEPSKEKDIAEGDLRLSLTPPPPGYPLPSCP